MKHSTKLADLLQSIFALHRAWLTCLAALVIALFKAKTVNLAQLATAFPGTAQIDSHYRRLQRFFKDIHLQPAGIATFVLACLYPMPPTPWLWTEPSGCLEGCRSTSSSCPSSTTASPFLFSFVSWPNGATPPAFVESCPVKHGR